MKRPGIDSEIRLQKATFGVQYDPINNKNISMAKSIKLSEELVIEATAHAKAQHRTPPKQIEHWARIGKIAEENPDLTMGFVSDILIGLVEIKQHEISDYRFG